VDVPDPKYVKTDDGAYIAYQTVGDGPADIAWLFDFTGNIDCYWDSVANRAWFESLASFGRLILHDRRGTVLSSRDVPTPELQTLVADLRAVLDAADSAAAVIGSWWIGIAPAVLLAASDPQRVRALLWWYPWPRATWAPDYPWGQEAEQSEKELAALAGWGTTEYGLAWADEFERANGFRPTADEIRFEARAARNTCTPDVALALTQLWLQTDIRAVLPTVQAPTLLLTDEPDSEVGAVADYVATLMPNATIANMPKASWPRTYAEADALYRPYQQAAQRFIGITPGSLRTDTVLATVLFTDIVESTKRQSELGDRSWKLLVEQHHMAVRDALGTWRGVEQDTAGDGFYATFDSPARAIQCGLDICRNVRELGVEVRAGVHTGECELIDGKVGGIAVAIGSRVAALSGPSQVLVSQTVKDLVAGSGFTFEPFGEHELKGIPHRWRLYAAT
jgi:class 3 adenylate cyclase